MSWCWQMAVFGSECHCTLKHQRIIMAWKQIMPETTSRLEGQWFTSSNPLGGVQGFSVQVVCRQRLRVTGGSNLIISTVLATFAHLRGRMRGNRTACALNLPPVGFWA